MGAYLAQESEHASGAVCHEMGLEPGWVLPSLPGLTELELRMSGLRQLDLLISLAA
jgi:hypothetical protein